MPRPSMIHVQTAGHYVTCHNICRVFSQCSSENEQNNGVYNLILVLFEFRPIPLDSVTNIVGCYYEVISIDDQEYS